MADASITSHLLGGQPLPVGDMASTQGTGSPPIYPRLPPLEASRHYTIPDSMEHIGDKSDDYALLRQEYDAKMRLMEPDEIFSQDHYHTFEFTPMPMEGGSEGVFQDESDTLEQVLYDIYSCPEVPPVGYPYTWPLEDVLGHWAADDAEVPEDRKIFQGLCVFDFEKDHSKALTYREAQVPFIVRNDPEVHKAVHRWHQPDYIERMLGPSKKYKTEYSESSRFLYWKLSKTSKKSKISKQKDWKAPTAKLKMTYKNWLQRAIVTDPSLLGPNRPHFYFHLMACGELGPEGQCTIDSSEALFDEFTFFQPKKSVYLIEPDHQMGIHCKFGMKGVFAQTHFDTGSNMIALLGGVRRYILAHPDQCQNFALFPKGHPSERHSAVDWANPDLEEYPEFGLAHGNEVVMQPGEVLHLPTHWFHSIVSLTTTFQCNTWTGLVSSEYDDHIKDCGF
jgi:hypothetical protein